MKEKMGKDFFDSKKEPEEVERLEGKKELEKIKIGEKEYTQEELSELVGLGELTKEVETKYNTKLDKVWPEYTKTTQELKVLKEEKEKWEEERAKGKVLTGEQLSEEEIAKQAREQAKRIGIALSDEVEEKVTRKVMEVLEARDLLNTCKDHEEEINGKDGRPVFKTQEILAYMDETGIKNPEKAYKDKYEEELTRWKEEEFKKVKSRGLVTEERGGGGAKEPKPLKVDKTNFEELVREALEGKI